MDSLTSSTLLPSSTPNPSSPPQPTVASAIPDLDIDELLDAHMPLDDDDHTNPDVGLLAQSWINERSAPEILPYRGVLVENLLELIDKQSELVSEMFEDPTRRFECVIYQTEMERIRWLIRSYLRTRLHKIERYATHILNDPESFSRLSDEEREYVEQYHSIVSEHYHKAFLSLLPEEQRKQDEVDNFTDLSMVATPSLDDAVFCRVMEDLGEVELEGSNEFVDMTTGDIYLLRYRDVRKLLEQERVKLI
ncbi:uncharacterized protein VTP21DRAFT_6965 [Calcarisporiella thermophila]|uniref:uncharacterized protein n=1 Tax=Calcarisporiella thermophila TaxID=911321 RepID=UPI003742BAAB